MWLHKAGQNADAGLQVITVDPDLGASLVVFQEGVLAAVPGIVLDDTVAIHHFLPQHADELLTGVGTVHAGAVHQCNVLSGHACRRQNLEDRRQENMGGRRPGDITERDGDGVFGVHELGQWR
jgi:hypothetical protein